LKRNFKFQHFTSISMTCTSPETRDTERRKKEKWMLPLFVEHVFIILLYTIGPHC